MKNKLVATFIFLSAVASASEVCEIGSIASNISTEAGSTSVVFVNCTNWNVFDGLKIFYNDYSGVYKIAESN